MQACNNEGFVYISLMWAHILFLLQYVSTKKTGAQNGMNVSIEA